MFIIVHFSEPEYCRHNGVVAERDLQLCLHADRSLALWQCLLQDMLLHINNLSLWFSLHTRRHCCRQVRGLLRPERSEGLPFFCVASTRGNRGSSWTSESCSENAQMLMKIGRGGPDEVSEGPNELFAKTATRGPSLFSKRNPKMAVLGPERAQNAKLRPFLFLNGG